MPATRRATTQLTQATTGNVGFLLAKASSRWNQQLEAAFAARGFPEVRAAYGSVLLPLFECDGLRMSDLTAAARQPKQTTTTLVRQLERDGLVHRVRDDGDARVWRVWLAPRGDAFRAAAEDALRALDARFAEHLTRPALDTLRQALHAFLDL